MNSIYEFFGINNELPLRITAQLEMETQETKMYFGLSYDSDKEYKKFADDFAKEAAKPENKNGFSMYKVRPAYLLYLKKYYTIKDSSNHSYLYFIPIV